MTDKYPTEAELKTIANWDTLEGPVPDLLEFVKSLWWIPERHFKLSGKRVLRLELLTGGWSGNEDIIVALQQNYMFWTMYWQKSTRGGHYYFRIDLRAGGE